MAIQASGQSNTHWNYFLALDRDMEVLSRYVELAPPNFATYSIELAHLLIAAASEVDVLCKLLCAHYDSAVPRNNINDYRAVITTEIPDFHTVTVEVPRYALILKPWDNWQGTNSPDWWRSHNRVKHERDAYFAEATVHNTLNALGALLSLNYLLQFTKLTPTGNVLRDAKATTYHLAPPSALLRLPANYYYDHVVV
jgi:hypothetical protein